MNIGFPLYADSVRVYICLDFLVLEPRDPCKYVHKLPCTKGCGCSPWLYCGGLSQRSGYLCLLRHVSRKLGQKPSSWDANQHSNMGCRIASRILLPCTTMLAPALLPFPLCRENPFSIAPISPFSITPIPPCRENPFSELCLV